MTDEAIKQAAEIIFNQREFTEEQKMLQMIAFFSGAKWRINSVWHDTCDIAEPGKDCLVEHLDGDGNVCIRIDWRSEYEWVNACHYDKVLRWAYVSDLLPDRKEVQP